ncbi:MAG TPA: SGNH/GDSL hydrolase family protein [Sphingomicrobium sp.]|nr:SGNH/GDSL hydrolase family protein [Sphingomicrobium sp.]
MAYSGFYVFGDSLVDAGNALKLAQFYGDLTFSDLPDGAPDAELGYFQGRFSNGYTFADLLANKTIGTVTEPVFPYGYEDPWFGIPIAPWASDPNGINLNFAYGGAQIRQGDEAVPDLDGQTDAFRDAVDGDADPNALYLVTVGGNDVRTLAPSGSAPVPQDEAYIALDKAAEKLLTELSQLVEIGVEYILITGVPDVGLIPKYDRDGNLVLDATELQRSEAATEYSIYLDTLIRTEVVPALQAMGATVTYVPLMDYVDASGTLVTGALNANLPTIAALHGLTTDELSDNLLQHQDLLFFDQIHPNAQANALLGAYIYAQLTGTPWIETLPLTGADVDYLLGASITVAGEVDQLVVSLVAGTTYTLEMLGMSSLGTPGSLGDPALQLLGPSGSLFASNADDGAGFDATLTFIAATTGNYTVELSGTGTLTGSYFLQAAVVSGAAMEAGNTYTISNALTVVLEGVGGFGQDVVKAGVSYALSAGSEIEVLQTTNNKGKAAINLTGNEFGQAIIGNSGSNILEGKGGADVFTGGAGKDVFVLSNSAVTSPGSGNIDRITDYGRGDVVDVSQILSVAAGTNVISAGYLRVTTSGKIQVDLDGGGDEWVTLSTINGTAAVTVRYLSGGTVTNTSVNRVTETQLKSASAANTNIALAGAVAAAGLMSAPAAAETIATAQDSFVVAGATAGGRATGVTIESRDDAARLALTGENKESVVDGLDATFVQVADVHRASDFGSVGGDAPLVSPTELLSATDAPEHSEIVAEAVAMLSAEMLLALRPDAGIAAEAKATAEVGRVLADALSGGGGEVGQRIDALLDALAGRDVAPLAAIESIASVAAIASWTIGHTELALSANHAFSAEAIVLHQDAQLPA